MQLKRTIGEFPESYFAIWKSISADHSTAALFFAFGFASLTFIRKEGCKELENKEFMGRRRLETVKGEKVTYEKCQDWNLMFQCARAQLYILQISRFSHFLIYALPKSKAILENSFDLFTLFHGESKWEMVAHIQLFLFCWCWITTFFLSDRN